MAKRQFQNGDFALGLTWLAPGAVAPNSNRSNKFRELRSIKPTPCGFVEFNTPSGIQIGGVTEPEDIGTESAAARLAISQSSAVLIEQLSTDEYWLCAVEDGAVFPAGDIVGNKDLIENRLTEIKTDIAGTNIQLYDKEGHFNLSNAMPLGFLDLISEVPPDSVPICQPANRNFPIKKLTGTVAGILVIIGTYLTWTHLLNYERVDETEKLQIERQAKALDEERKLVREALMQNAPALLASFTDMIYERPLRAGGWRNHSYEWHNNKVTASWRREHGNLSLITAYLGNRNHEFNEATGHMIEQFEFPAPQLPENSSLESLLGNESERYGILDTLSDLPGKWTLGPNRSAGTLYKYKRATLNGAATKLTNVIFVARAFIGHPLRINRIKVSLDRQFNWEIQGDVYANQN